MNSPLADAWGKRYVQRDWEKREGELATDMDRYRSGLKSPTSQVQSSTGTFPWQAPQLDPTLAQKENGTFGSLRLNPNQLPVENGTDLKQGVSSNWATFSPSVTSGSAFDMDSLRAKILKNGSRLYGGEKIRQMMDDAEYQNDLNSIQLKMSSLSTQELLNELMRMDMKHNRGRATPALLLGNRPSYETKVIPMESEFAVMTTNSNNPGDLKMTYYPYKRNV